MSVQINNTGKTTFTPEEQLELQKRLSAAKSQQEKEAIFDAYKKEVGLVENPTPVSGNEPVARAKAAEKPVMGTAVEANPANRKQQDKNIISQTSTSFINYNVIVENLKNNGANLDENGQKLLLEAFKNAGIPVNADGTVAFDKAKLETAITNFAKANGQTILNVTGQGADEVTGSLVEGGHITKNEDGSFVVNGKEGREAVYKAFPEQTGQPITTKEDKAFKLTVKKTNTVVRKESAVDIPDDAEYNKDSEKLLKKEYENFLRKEIAKPEMAKIVDNSIALGKYSKKITKQAAKIQKECEGRETSILDKYISGKYATKEEKEAVNNLLSDLEVTNVDPNDRENYEKLLVKAWNDSLSGDQQKITSLSQLKEQDVTTADKLAREAQKTNEDILVSAWNAKSGEKQISSLAELSEPQINVAKKLAITCTKGFDAEILAQRMAAKDVLNDRSEETIAKDKEWFIEEQAERLVKRDITNQRINNTSVSFSKQDRKAAQARIDAIVDKYKSQGLSKKEAMQKAREEASAKGLKMYNSDIGDRGRKLVMAAPNVFCTEGTADDNDFSLDVNGKTVYYKFSEQKYREFCDRAVNTSDSARYSKDNNMTLNEAREMLGSKYTLFDKDNNPISFDKAMGNDNKKIGNREVNYLRHFAEAGGYSIDKNPTAAKRVLHLVTQAGIGAGLGVVGGNLVAELAGSVVRGGVGMTEGQTVIAPEQTIATPSYHIEHQVNFTFNGKTFTKNVITDIPEGSVIAPAQSINVKGQEYSYQTKGKNIGSSRLAGAAIGAVGGVLSALPGLNNIVAAGQFEDWTIPTEKVVTESNTEYVAVDMNYPKFITTEERAFESEQEIPKLKAVRYRESEAYHKMYKYEDGTPVSNTDFRKAYQEKTGHKYMTKGYFYLFPELEINGKKIVPIDDYMSEYEKIAEGVRGNIKNTAYNGVQYKKVHAKLVTQSR